MRTGALLALALFAMPAVSAAAVVTITGQIGSYETDTSVTYLDEDGNPQSYVTTEKHFHGGYAGAKYTISFDAEADMAQSFKIDSPEPLFQFPNVADWDGTTVNGDNLDGGSSGYEGEYINVSTSGTGVFIDRQGYQDGLGGGNETDLILHLFPLNSPVPEPSSWALMLIGLAGIGGVMRTRVKTVKNA